MIKSLHPQCTQLTVVQATAPPRLTIFNYCWKVGGRSGSCPIPTEIPVVKAGEIVAITADISNSGPIGRANVIFKIDGVAVYNDTNVSLGTFPGGGLWSPTYNGYVMPNKDVQLTIEAYAWDASKNAWILNDTKSIKISTVSAGCIGLDLAPYSAIIKIGEKVDMVAAVSPGNVQFTVTFKGGTVGGVETVLGTCKTSGTGLATGSSTCPFTWDSNVHGKGQAGTYFVKAYADSCVSIQSVIDVGVAIRQWNFGVTVKDSVTGSFVSGATVLVATTGGASQSKVTDSSGFATFRMDEGTISISISKNGYNTLNTAESLFRDMSIAYNLAPIPTVPTVGDIEFVSVPTGADVLIDGKATGQKTPITITGIPAGEHTWAMKLGGYNDSSGKVVVPSGGTTSVYASLTIVTPTAGSLNITSHPVMGAEVWIDGTDMKVTTSGATIVTDIPPGVHSYVLTMTGFQDARGSFDIKAGQTTYLDVELVPLTTIGTLEIDSEPSGARIWVDDKDSGYNTPATIGNLVEGDHRYKIVLSGYKDIIGVVTIKAAATKIVHLILEKSGPGIEAAAAVAIAGVAVLGFLAKGEERR